MAAGWMTRVRSRTDCRDPCVARRLRKGGNERRPSNGLRFSQPNRALVRVRRSLFTSISPNNRIALLPLRVSHCLAVCDAFNFNPSPAAN
jgi:hypothetical protein